MIYRLHAISAFIAAIIGVSLLQAQTAAPRWSELLGQVNTLAASNQFDSALVIADLALAEAIQTNGYRDSSVAMVWHRISGIAMQQRLPETDSFFTEALRAWDRVDNPNQIERAKTLSNFGGWLQETSRLAEAEATLKECKSIREQLLPANHVDRARVAVRLAQTYLAQSRPDLARAEYLAAVEGFRANQPKFAVQLAEALNGVGMANYTMRQFGEAESNYREAIELSRQTPNVAGTARLLSNLANALLIQGEYPAADSALTEAERLLPYIPGAENSTPNWTAIAEYVNSRGLYWSERRELAAAESCFALSVNIKREQRTHSDAEVLRGEYNLANIYRDQGKYAQAESIYVEVLARRREKFRGDQRDIAFSLESLARLYWREGRQELAFDSAFAAVLMRSRLIANAAADLSEPELLQFSEQLRASADLCISVAMMSGLGHDRRARQAAEVILQTKGFVSDQVFRRQLQAPDDRSSLASILDRVLKSMSQRQTMIEYFGYGRYNDSLTSAVDNYLALVVAPPASRRIVDLGPVAGIDSLVEQYREQMEGVARAGHPPTADEAAEYRRLASQLYGRLVAPLKLKLLDQPLWIAPDGNLNKISFAGLCGEKSEYLVEQTPIHYLSAGRDLLRRSPSNPQAGELLVLANADFDASPLERIIKPELASIGVPLAKPVSHRRSLPDGCLQLRERGVAALPYTEAEGRAVAERWHELGHGRAELLNGAIASEDNLKLKGPSASVVYIAAHGYFLDSSCSAGDLPVNPLERSGILLAGANLLGRGAVEAGVDDGIVSAAEIAELDLKQTRLVVLSACESALGAIENGEGVYGLRRAFLLAGAQTVVSALWKIDDEATAEMMGELFSNAGETIGERIRRVQLARIKALRDQGRPDHPYSWGAFVATGQ